MSTSFRIRGSESGSLKGAGDTPSYVKTECGWSCLKIMPGERTLRLLFSAFLFCSVLFSITVWGEEPQMEKSETFSAFDNGFFAKGAKAFIADRKDEALSHFKESAKRCMKLGNRECMHANIVMIGQVHEAFASDYSLHAIYFEKVSDAESMRKSLEVALYYSEKALKAFEGTNSEPKIADALKLTAGIYKKLGDDEAASKYYLRAYELDRKLGRRIE
jgi:tetratricopeptide (TPR) repeat protein